LTRQSRYLKLKKLSKDRGNDRRSLGNLLCLFDKPERISSLGCAMTEKIRPMLEQVHRIRKQAQVATSSAMAIVALPDKALHKSTTVQGLALASFGPELLDWAVTLAGIFNESFELPGLLSLGIRAIGILWSIRGRKKSGIAVEMAKQLAKELKSKKV
jgi:hypothetical protein